MATASVTVSSRVSRARWQPAVATAFPLATDAAVWALARGGNAIDAAVSAAWSLCVCEPSGSGLGGHTTMLIRQATGRTFVIDGHSRAPALVSRRTVSRRDQAQGYRSCTVPSTPATLWFAQRRYGVLRPAAVFEPAIGAAEAGFHLTALQSKQTRWVASQLRSNAAACTIFLQGGKAPPPGTVLWQPELAATLRRLAREGGDDFYQGDLAQQIVTDMQRHGGLISRTDLAGLRLPVEREPLILRAGDHTISSVPEPGGGPQLLLAFRLAEALREFAGHDRLLRSALAVSGAFRERERNPAELSSRLANSVSLRDLAAGIARTHECTIAEGDEEPGETTHLVVADADGNVVSLTQSIQSLFGAKVAHAELGFLYNNYLRTCPRREHPHALASRCLPRSNVAPVLVTRHDHTGEYPVLALGGAGSRRIISAVLQVLLGVFEEGKGLAAAIAAPRVHGLLSGQAWVEAPAACDSLMRGLRKHFRQIVVKQRHDYSLGCVQALQLHASGKSSAAADPRRDGVSATLEDAGRPPCGA